MECLGIYCPGQGMTGEIEAGDRCMRVLLEI